MVDANLDRIAGRNQGLSDEAALILSVISGLTVEELINALVMVQE